MHRQPTQPPPRAGTACPTCGAPAEEGQLVCLECGSRVALAYRRPPSWRAPVAIVAAVVLLAAVAGAAALNAVDDDAKKEVAKTPIKAQQGSGAGKAKPKKPAAKPKRAAKKPARKRAPAKRKPSKKPAKKRPATPAGGGLVARGDLYAWPRSLKAFTVVLISTEDRVSATNFARSAAKDRPAKIGVIRSDDFDSLPQGFYVVFAGKYDSRAQADKAAARLSGRFQGAFPQLVER